MQGTESPTAIEQNICTIWYDIILTSEFTNAAVIEIVPVTAGRIPKYI